MFDALVASSPPQVVGPRTVTTSFLVHALIVTLAAVAAQGSLDAPPITAPDPGMLLFVPKPPPPPPPEVKPAPPPAAIVNTQPPPKGFQTVAALKDIPSVIPPPDLTQRPLDPRDFAGHGVEGGMADGVVGGIGPAANSPGSGELDVIYAATTSDDRFEPAIPLVQAAPRYPRPLASIGLEGRVVAEFVIDTAGMIEPASIRVVESSHAAFEAAAREALVGATFRPARLSTRPVRQLTRQAIRFIAAPSSAP
jgi:protein TonB